MNKEGDPIAEDAILAATHCGAPYEAIKRLVLQILHLSHWEWFAIDREARSCLRREAPVDSPPGDPHIELAQALEGLDDDAISALWQSWLEPREPWLLRAFEETDAMPQEHAGGQAFASGASRVKAAIPFSLRHMRAPSARLVLRLLHAGIEEKDPSFNEYFVAPAVRHLGLTRVLQEYTQVFQAGDDVARAGVISALYHTYYSEHGMCGLPREGEDASEIRRLRRELRLHVIDAFLGADDRPGSRLGRSAIAMISNLDPQSFRSTEERERCLEKALASGDDYTRARAQMMRDAPAPTTPLPPKPWWRFW